MDESKFGYTAYVGQTILHPLGLAALLVLSALLLALPRKYAVLPILLMLCFVAPAQRIILFSVNWTLLRLLLLCGLLRVGTRGESHGLRWTSLDVVIALWALSGTLAYTALHGTFAALQFKLGNAFDTLLTYFLFRCLVRDWDDAARVVTMIAFVSLPVAAIFLTEQSSGRNLFAFLGGVPEVTAIRDGKLRCQGPYGHPILAGCFWVMLMPLIAARWWRGGSARAIAALGTIASALIVALSYSSTPLMAVIFAFVGGLAYVLRFRMRAVRWSLVAALVILHVAMKGPVWSLVARINIVSGSTGWHRYYLIDQAIHRFSEWWLIGTLSTSHWDQWRRLEDVTNQYVLEGVRGGVLTMALFISVIVCAFVYVGRTWRAVQDNVSQVVLAWALGVSLFAHAMTFISVSYDAVVFSTWLLVVAMITSLAPAQVSQRAALRRRAPVPGSPASPRGVGRTQLSFCRRPTELTDTET